MNTITLKNVKVAATGKLPTLSRLQLQKLVEDLGGVWQKTVNKNTTMLIVGDGNPNRSKLQKATLFGTTMISEKQFVEMLIRLGNIKHK